MKILIFISLLFLLPSIAAETTFFDDQNEFFIMSNSEVQGAQGTSGIGSGGTFSRTYNIENTEVQEEQEKTSSEIKEETEQEKGSSTLAIAIIIMSVATVLILVSVVISRQRNKESRKKESIIKNLATSIEESRAAKK